MSAAIGILSLCGYALAIGATLLLPETRGIALDAAGTAQEMPAAALLDNRL
ncbi:MAG: hypothetical protein JOZ05_07825 [Acetobacteraceae bacterium]|nr:hypothetical protein [Acetobacteraceae bacterium]